MKRFRVWVKEYGYFVAPESYGYMSFAVHMDGRILHLSGDYLANSADAHQSGYIVQQYTGLEDENNVRIYEGDILVDGFDRMPNTPFCKYKVVFQNGGFGLQAWNGSFTPFYSVSASSCDDGGGVVCGKFYLKKPIIISNELTHPDWANL